MDAIDLIRRLHEHRIWANHNLVAAARGVSDEALRKTFAIGQGSIWKTLLHLYAAEYVWLESMLGHENAITPGDVPGKLPGNQEGPGAIGTLDELQTRWSDLDQRWQLFLRDLTPANLDEAIYRVSSNGMRFGTARSDALLHVCTHAHYTAAQAVNMFRQVGAEKLPEVMLIAMARMQAAKH